METRLDKEGFTNHGRELPFPNKFIVKKPYFGGGLALLWKFEVQLEVDDGFPWFLTGFCGWPEASEKKKFWTLLSHISSFVDGPWCCIGDSTRFCISQKSKVDIHLIINRWKSFRQHWTYVIYLI